MTLAMTLVMTLVMPCNAAHHVDVLTASQEHISNKTVTYNNMLSQKKELESYDVL